MSAVLVLLLLFAMPATAATPRGVLKTILARVCIQERGPLKMLGDALADDASEQVTNGPTSLAAMAGAFDSTEEALGTIFLDHPGTLGAGKVSSNLLTQAYTLTELNGVPLDPPHQTIVFTQPPVVAARVTLDARIHQAAVGLAATYGLTDALDVSLLLPLVSTWVRVEATRQVTDVQNTAGRFVPVHQPLVRRRGSGSGFSQGDLTVRGKWWFLETPLDLGATLAVQFPTGVPELLTGTGHYWADPGLAAAWPFWGGRAEVTGHVGMLVDLSEPSFSKISYGIGLSGVLIPGHLGVVAEVLGQSQITAHVNPEDTAVLTLTSDRQLREQSALALLFTRTDQIDLSVGLRAPLVALGALTVMVFATAVIPLNSQGLRPTGAFVTFGMGSAY